MQASKQSPSKAERNKMKSMYFLLVLTALFMLAVAKPLGTDAKVLDYWKPIPRNILHRNGVIHLLIDIYGGDAKIRGGAKTKNTNVQGGRFSNTGTISGKIG